jgi:hypothetical protein
VEAARAIRQAEGRRRQNHDRTDRCGLKPERLAADSAYGSAPSLNWLVEEQGISPPVFDKSQRRDGTRADVHHDEARNVYICQANTTLTTRGTVVTGCSIAPASSTASLVKAQCCPKEPVRKIPRSISERARDVARSFLGSEAYDRSRRKRKKVERLFAHLKRIIGLRRLRLRGASGAKDEFLLAATFRT